MKQHTDIHRAGIDKGRLMLSAVILGAALILTMGVSRLRAGDWPTYMHDNYRSGTTTEQLNVPLHEDWSYHTSRRPRPSWSDTPALQDFWNGSYGHKSRVNVDRTSQAAVVGNRLFFGSSHSDKVICLDSRSGAQYWQFFTGGPVRFAPAVDSGKVYFGSDDGYVYCLDTTDGSELWKHRATGSEDLMFAGGRMVSTCPVRTCVLVEGGVAYWGAGMFNGYQTGLDWYLCARSADTGTHLWKVTPSRRMLGYLLSLGSGLYVPAGKLWPYIYNKSTGAYQGSMGGSQGGCYAFITDVSSEVLGPYWGGSGSYINDFTFGAVYGNFLIVKSGYSYYCTDTNLIKVLRSNHQQQWNVGSSYGQALILAGNTLFAGGDDGVAAFNTSNGQQIWTGAINGRALGLAVANGRLYISTDLGTIYAFGNAESPQAYNRADFNQNGQVDLPDLMMLMEKWLDCTNPNDISCTPYTP